MITEADLSTRYHAALGIAHELGLAAMRYFGDASALDISMKGSQDWLTAADGAVETQFRKAIAAAFPGDVVIGEEHGGSVGERVWIIDPIDGTANFARNDRQWCVSIAFLAYGVPEIGVIHAPALSETYAARRGRGATMNGAPIKVSGTRDIDRAIIEFGWSPRRPLEAYLQGVANVYALGASVRRSGSGALGVAQVAIGRSDAYAELHINSWDAAAGIVIAQEAGATVNAFCSGDWIASGNPLLVSTPELYPTLEAASGVKTAAKPG